MSYQRSNRNRHLRRQAMGDVAATVSAALQRATGAIGIAASAASDPYLPEVVCRIHQLEMIEGRRPVPQCVRIAPNLAGGIGLRKAVAPLRAYVYAEQNPWVYPVAIGVAIGVPFLFGYLVGRP